MNAYKSNIEILILAAGASNRLGQPKQLLKFQEDVLVKKIVKEASKPALGCVNVVTGAYRNEVEAVLAEEHVSMIYNQNWKQGMGASISTGIKSITSKKSRVDGVLLLTVDQPFITAHHLQMMYEKFRPNQQMIIATGYNETFGIPVLVDQSYFDALSLLSGEKGGKGIFIKHKERLTIVDNPKASIDIDTAKDLKALNKFK